MGDARAKAKAWRESAGLSQKEAAERLGIPQTTVSAIERGFRPCSLEQAAAYKRVAGIDLEEWVDVQDPASAPPDSGTNGAAA